MKIGILVEDLKVGGAEKIALQEVKSLRKLGMDAKLLVLRGSSRGEEDVFEFKGENIPVVVLDSRFPKFLRFNFKFPTFAFFSLFHLSYPLFLPFFVKKSEFDYIISHGSYTSFSAITLKLTKGIPFAIFFWDPIYYILNRVYEGKFFSPLLKLFSILGRQVDYILLRLSGSVLVGGDQHTEYFRGLYRKVKVVRILPGTVFGEPTKNKKKYVFALTAWKEGKRPEYMIELAKKLPGVSFKIGGKWLSENLLKKFRQELRKNGVEEQFEVLDYIPEEELRKIYSEATLLLTTNLEKGFGMPVLEAAACGTTFIVPKGSGVCAVFEDGKDGFFSKEWDTEDITKKIKLLIEDSELAVEMGLNAYNKAKEGFTWENHAKSLLKAIKL